MAAKRKTSDPHARGAGGGGKAKGRSSGGRGKSRKSYAERTPVGETPAPDVRPAWWRPFFGAYAVHGTKTSAARVVGTEYRTILNYLRDHPGLQDEFDASAKEAREEHVDRLLTEVNRRGVLGFMEPVVYKGRIMYEVDPDNPGQMRPVTIRKHSDRALELAVRIAMPDKFRAPASGSPFDPGGAPGGVAPVASIVIMPTGPEFVPPADEDDKPS